MMFLGMVAVCVLTAIATVRRPVVAVTIVLALAIALPFGASQSLLGTGWHPATVLSVAVFVVQCGRDLGAAGRDLARMFGSVLAIGSFIVVAAIASYFGFRMASFGTVILQIVAPFLLFIIVRRLGAADPRATRLVARNLVLLACAEAVVVVGVGVGVVPQPWGVAVQTSRWYAVDPTRMAGTLDHPLVAALWLAAAVPLSLTIRRIWLRAGAMLLLLAAIIQTGSRASLLVAAAAMLVVLLRSRGHLLVKVVLTSAVAAIGAALFLGPLGTTLSARFSDDAGSSAIRLKSLELAGQIWTQTIIVGRGAGASESVTRNALIGSTFENPLLISMVDFGLIGTALLFGTMIVLVLARPGAARVAGARVAAAGVLIGTLGFNSLGTNAAVGTLMFVVIALAAAPIRARDGSAVGTYSTAPGLAVSLDVPSAVASAPEDRLDDRVGR